MSDQNTSSTQSIYFIIDPVLFHTFRVVNASCLSEFIGLFGIVANMINIHIFRRQGYHDGVNVTLTALAISDIGALMVQQVYNMLVIPSIHDTDVIVLKSMLIIDVMYVNEYFVRVSSAVTSFAAVTRCLSVTLPMKVRNIVTTKVAVVINVIIFHVLTLYLFPSFYSILYEWRPVPHENKTILYPYYRSNSEDVFRVSYNFTDFILPFGAFFTLILCSIVIYVKLRSMARWRMSTSVSFLNNISFSCKREMRTGVMLITISLMCVAFVFPRSALFTAVGIVREMKLSGVYKDITAMGVAFTSLLETVNCSVTIFVYYKMSSRYRTEFHRAFPRLQRCLVKF